MSIRQVYDEAYVRATTEAPLAVSERQQLCKDYAKVMKALPEADRAHVSNILAAVINHYQDSTKAPRSKAVTLKHRTVPGAKGTTTRFYDLESLPEVLGMVVLYVLEYIFPL